jgi:hypothetical protein
VELCTRPELKRTRTHGVTNAHACFAQLTSGAKRNVRHKLVALLLRGGADPNAVSADCGVTPLAVAASKGDAPMACLLLRWGAIPTAANAAGIPPFVREAGNGAPRVHPSWLEPAPNGRALDLLKQAVMPWAPKRHCLFGWRQRRTVFAVLLCRARLDTSRPVADRDDEKTIFRREKSQSDVDLCVYIALRLFSLHHNPPPCSLAYLLACW